MSILTRPRIAPQQRLDLEDWDSLLSALRTDSQLWHRQFLSGTNLIIKGFQVSGLGLNAATVAMGDATLFLPQSTTDFSYFIASTSEPDIVVSDADLTDGVRNYLEIELCTANSTPLTKAFWDPEANAGSGAEFNQISNTMTDIQAKIVVNTAGFTGLPDRIPLAIIDTDGGGAIQVILDRRRLFGRLATPQNIDNEFSWSPKIEPVYQIGLSAITGVFLAEEVITLGGETAQVVVGGTSAITINEPTGINFFSGNAVSGATSGATATLNTVIESFTGVDKSIQNVKGILDALMTEIKLIKQTRFWWQDAPFSLTGIASFLDSILVQASTGQRFEWDGANLSITDSVLSPTNADVMGILRELGKSTQRNLTRQSDGQETQNIAFSAIPDVGTLTLDQNGDISNPINAGDDAATIQTACNATWTNLVTVTGSFAESFTFKFDVPGPQVELLENSNTLLAGAVAITLTVSTLQNGLAGITPIPIGVGQVMFIQVPTTGDRTYSGVGITNTNYQVVDLADYVNADGNYWVAFNENGLLYLRTGGELATGESTPISDPDKETILALIESNQNTVRQNANAKLVGGGTWALVDNAGVYELTNSMDAYVAIGGQTPERNTVGIQTINFPVVNSTAWVEVQRLSGAPVVVPVNVGVDSQINLTNDTQIIARRVADGVLIGDSFLLKPGEFLELDGALAEINRLLGQLRIIPHETDATRLRITGADINLLDSAINTQVVGDFLLQFDGAVIRLVTGEIFAADDSTPLGINFTPPVIPLNEFFWLGVSLNPGAITATNRQLATVQIDLATTSDLVAGSAPNAVITGQIKLGAIQIQNQAGTLTHTQINRLGVGSGSGVGAGGSDRRFYENRLDFSIFNLASVNVFADDQATNVDGVSTGAFSPANRAFSLANGETLIDTNNAVDPDFLIQNKDITKAEIYLRFAENGIDPAGIYDLSLDGGLNYETVSVDAIGSTNGYRGFHVFADAAPNVTLDAQANPDTNQALVDTGIGESRAMRFIPAQIQVIKALDLTLNKTEALLGNVKGFLTVKIVLDDAGAPSVDVDAIISESDLINIETSVVVGNSTINIPMPKRVLLANQIYWIVLETDAAYKASFITGIDELSIRADTTTPIADGSVFDGAVWAATIGESGTFSTLGRVLDLRFRFTASQNDVLIESYGIFYDDSIGKTGSVGDIGVDVFQFSGSLNQTDFVLTNISNPNNKLLEVYDAFRGQVYIPTEGVFRIDGQTLKFEPNFFDFPGENIVLHIRQNKVGAFDSSDQNATDIAGILNNLVDIGDQLEAGQSGVVLAKIPAPFTEVQNRALLPDFTMDLGVRFGIDRIPIQESYVINNESGPNGEVVRGAVNDQFGQLRFVGGWVNVNGSSGVGVLGSTLNDFIEITFFGTGLNILTEDSGVSDWRSTLDGGTESGSSIFPTGLASVLSARHYAPNTLLPVISGLLLSIHTIKIRINSGDGIVYGFEILSEESSGNLTINPGIQLFKGKRLIHPITTQLPFNSGFEGGILGIKGGRVAVYQKSDGSIAHMINPVDGAQLNLGAANHVNEILINNHRLQEFGVGRSDDYSQALLTAPYSFTLSDGSTTLTSENARIISTGGIALEHEVTSTSDPVVINFIGTGLDVEILNGVSATTKVTEVFIDGVSIGFLGNNIGGGQQTYKVVSGLSYGAHRIRFNIQGTSGQNTPHRFTNFKIYVPNIPPTPFGAVILADYFLTGNFVTNTLPGSDTLGQGVIRKGNTQEVNYLGAGFTFTVPNPSLPSGFTVQLNNITSSVTYSFFGTGVDIRFTAASNSGFVLSLNGGSDFSGFTTSLYSSVGGSAFIPITGVFTQGGVGSAVNGEGISISNLPLGFHQIILESTTGNRINFQGLDIITPTHTYSDNGPLNLQNAFRIGNQSILDTRNFKTQDLIQGIDTNQAIRTVSTFLTTNVIVWVVIPGQVTTFKVSKPGMYELKGQAALSDTVTIGNPIYNISLNGEVVAQTTIADVTLSNNPISVHTSTIIFLNLGDYVLEGRIRVLNSGQADIQLLDTQQISVKRLN